MRWLAPAIAFLIGSVGAAVAQSNVQVIGPITPGHCPQFSSNSIIKDGGFSCNGSPAVSFANPSATAGPAAINGSATTAMRSDAAPAVQKGTNSQFGIVEGDGSTIDCSVTPGICIAKVNAILPTPTRAGDIIYWNGTTWVTLAGNNSGTQVLTENSSGNPSWAPPTATTILTEPQGRLTLQANTPVMSTTNAAQTTLRYDCYIGAQVPYFSGSVDVIDTITSCEVTDAMVSAASAGQVVSGQVYDAWWVHSGANRICLAMSASTGGGGGWASDTGGSNTARGTGYSQLDLTTRPYVTNKNSIANCFNGATNYGSVSANQATYLGTVLASANGQVTWQFAVIGTSGGTGGIFGVYNYYNRVDVGTVGGDTSTGYTDTTAGWRQARGTTVMQVQYVAGGASAQDPVQATFTSVTSTSSPFCGVGIGADTTAAPSNGAGVASSLNNGTTAATSLTAVYTGYPGIGLHLITPIEFGATTCTPNFASAPLSGNNYTFKLRM